jgi:hypothetical protein
MFCGRLWKFCGWKYYYLVNIIMLMGRIRTTGTARTHGQNQVRAVGVRPQVVVGRIALAPGLAPGEAVIGKGFARLLVKTVTA